MSGMKISKKKKLKGSLDNADGDAAEATPKTRAQRFVATHAMHADGPILRRWRGDWYGWDAARGCYVPQSDETIDAALYRALDLQDRRSVSDVRHALISVDDVLIDWHDLGAWLGKPSIDADARDVAVAPNGLIDLRTGALAPATPRYFSTSALGVAYDADAPTPSRWLEFLRSLWPTDDESIVALQDWFGYMLTPDTRQQKIMLLVGPKRSGKGTIMRMLTSMLGAASVAAPTLASLGTNFGLWPLIGKTAAIIGDARLGGRADVAQIVERLLSISGQDPHTIDRKHREPWTGFLSTRVTIVSNELPKFSDPSGALPGRMHTLVLTESWYGREDTALTDALLAELPGILLWAIEGWRRLRARGHFVTPESSRSTTDELADLASPVAAWVREMCTREGADPKVTCDEAYAAYRLWCSRNGHHVVPNNTFGRDLAAATSCTRKQRRVGEGKPVWHYLGIALAPRETGGSDMNALMVRLGARPSVTSVTS